jgi:O-antigen ligase
MVRLGRTQGALYAILQNPLGLGWSGAGLVHNDYLQITADLGIVPGILFILWYLRTLISVSRAFYKSPNPLMHALVGAFMLCGGLFLTQPMVQLPQYAAPIWFVWALVETELGQITEKEGGYDASKTDRARSDLQLPEASAPMSGVREMGR